MYERTGNAEAVSGIQREVRHDMDRQGKDAFFRMNEQLKNRTEACGERVRDTVIALTNSLNKYYELENSTFERNKALDAGNIF